jgi:hypothetical protein
LFIPPTSSHTPSSEFSRRRDSATPPRLHLLCPLYIIRVPLFLPFSYLATAVWARGYQGCLERVWQFLAYEIDGFNDKADRIIGYGYAKWDEDNKKYKVDWTPYKGKGGDRCNFEDWNFFLGRAPVRTG